MCSDQTSQRRIVNELDSAAPSGSRSKAEVSHCLSAETIDPLSVKSHCVGVDVYDLRIEEFPSCLAPSISPVLATETPHIPLTRYWVCRQPFFPS